VDRSSRGKGCRAARHARGTGFSVGFKGRGLIIFISDMMEGEDEIIQFLKSMRFAHNDCLLVQVLDQDELDFPFDRNVRFIGLEDKKETVTAPGLIRENYLAGLNKHLEYIATECRKNQIDYLKISSSDDLDHVLAAYLNKRQEMH